MTLEMLLAHPAVQAVGRALLHFLWQGSLAALLLWVVRAIVPASAARVRYAAASLLLTAMPLVLIVTIAKDLPVGSRNTKQVTRPVVQAAASTLPKGAVLYAPTASRPWAGVSGWAVCIWIAGVFVLSLRALGGWTRAQRLKLQVQAGGAELEAMLGRLKSRMGVSAPVRVYTSAIVRVPMVIGWIRPYILLPVMALTGLGAAQIDALLAHELAHIRRHDYLVNLFQTAIETALFYHPAVWWVGKQMRLEREHCCDDMAVAMCGSVFEYANALAEMEEIRGRNMEPAMAANGGELVCRIRRLLGQPEPPSQSATLAVVLALLIAGATAAVSLKAAPQEAQPAFDVASIRPAQPGTPPSFGVGNGGGGGANVTLKTLIAFAYQLQEYRILGGPGWIGSDRFNIEARAADPTIPPDQLKLMLRSLFADRFKLSVHREIKESNVYNLVVAKGGPKIKLSADQTPTDINGPAPPGAGPNHGAIRLGGGSMIGNATPLSRFANLLSQRLDRVVIDKTNLTGRFDIGLRWTPDVGENPLSPTGDPLPAEPGDAPSIFVAIQEQLGLKLEAAKGPVEFLVIDHVEKPSEN